MIDSRDIYRVIKETLEANIKDIKVQTKDIKNPRPPCLYIKPITDTNNQTASEYETVNYSYAVIYFSEVATLEDLLDVKERLKKIFKKPLKVVAYDDEEDVNYLDVSNLSFTLDEDDYFLNAVLNIEHIQPLGVARFESENTEIMEEMELTVDSSNNERK